MEKVEKRYDFFSIYKHSKAKKQSGGFDENGNNYDFSIIDQALNSRFEGTESSLNLIKLNSYSYAGITNIKCARADGSFYPSGSKIDLSGEHLWVFNIEKANTQNKAIIVKVTDDVKKGRKEYGDSPEEGAATDTVVCFNPKNGVVVIPPRSGMGISKIEQFFYKITVPRQSNLTEKIVVDRTTINNLDSIDKINEVNFRISNIATAEDKEKNAGISIFNKIENEKLAIKLYGGDLNVHETVKRIKSIIGIGVVEKLLIDGEHNDEHQLIDLVNNRMIAANMVQLVNGKPSMDSMLDSVKNAYMDNKTKLDISSTMKGHKGV